MKSPIISVSEAAVSQKQRKLEQAGPDALQLRTASGRPAKLDAATRQALVEKLEAGAIAAGFPCSQQIYRKRKQDLNHS